MPIALIVSKNVYVTDVLLSGRCRGVDSTLERTMIMSETSPRINVVTFLTKESVLDASAQYAVGSGRTPTLRTPQD